jgi:hypothetical protein
MPAFILYLSLLIAILSVATLQSPWNPGRTGLINNIFSRKDGNYLQGKKQQDLHRTDHLLGNNDLLIMTRFLHSSDDSDNDFREAPP